MKTSRQPGVAEKPVGQAGPGTAGVRRTLLIAGCAAVSVIAGCGSQSDARDGVDGVYAGLPRSPGQTPGAAPKEILVDLTAAPAGETGKPDVKAIGGIEDRSGVLVGQTGPVSPEQTFMYAQQSSDWQFQQIGTPVFSGEPHDLRISNLMSNRGVNGPLDSLPGVTARSGPGHPGDAATKKEADPHADKAVIQNEDPKADVSPDPKAGVPQAPSAASPAVRAPIQASTKEKGAPHGNAAPAEPTPSKPSSERNDPPPPESKDDFVKPRAQDPASGTGKPPAKDEGGKGEPRAGGGGGAGGRDLPTPSERHRRDSDAPAAVPVGDSKLSQIARDASGPGNVAPRFDEELWIIASVPGQGRGRGDAIPTTGSLLAKPVAGGEEVPLWIESTRVSGLIDGMAASVTFEQRFRNTLDAPVDVIYAFPLPADASVTDFVMSVGTRKIRGIIREREEAQRLFAEATRQGYRASLVLQDRPSLFTQRLSNVPGSAVIETSISYVQPLRASGGSFVMELPTSVESARSPVADGFGPTLDLSITARSDYSQVLSPSHALDAARDAQGVWRVALSDGSARAAGNLRLRLTPAGKGTLTRLLTEPTDGGTIVALTIVAPDEFSTSARAPTDMLLVIDTGLEPGALERAKLTALIALSRLTPRDRVRVVAAGPDGIAADRAQCEPVTGDVVRSAAAFVQGITPSLARGKLAPALAHRWAEAAVQRVVVTMTSGAADTEPDLFLAARSMPKGTRVLSLGFGDAVNRRMVDGLARVSGGAAAYLGPADEPADAIDPFLDTALRPALRNLWVDWNGADVVDVYPRNLPDVLPGKPVVIYGVLRGAPSPAFVTVHGEAGGADAEVRVPWLAPSGQGRAGVISTLWAKQKLSQLAEDLALDPYNAALKGAMVNVARRHNLVSPFTSFVVVDATEPLARD